MNRIYFACKENQIENETHVEQFTNLWIPCETTIFFISIICNIPISYMHNYITDKFPCMWVMNRNSNVFAIRKSLNSG